MGSGKGYVNIPLCRFDACPPPYHLSNLGKGVMKEDRFIRLTIAIWFLVGMATMVCIMFILKYFGIL